MTDEPLWILTDVVLTTAGELVGPHVGPWHPLTGVSIDSRTIQPGDLFVALKGDQLDGHDYVAAALARGAGAALVERGIYDASRAGVASPFDLPAPLVGVHDTLTALVNLGRAARARTEARIVAVTGSVGKTGTKEMLRHCLEPEGQTHAAVKSFNNHWGVPLTLARMLRETEFGVFEIGMNHAGEITPLVKMVRPDVAIVTTVEPVHLEFFPSVEAIADAKAEIFSGLLPGGTAIINRDNPHYERLRAVAQAKGARLVAFGEHREADVRLLEVALDAEGSSFRVSIEGGTLDVRLGAPGRHLVQNALAVLAAMPALGVDPARAAARLEGVVAEQGRGARSRLVAPGGEVLLIDESYNANPASMRAAIAALGQLPRERAARRIAVLGDMRELGEASPRLHRELAEPLEAAGIDLVFACGPHMAELWAATPDGRRGAYAARSEELVEALVSSVEAGDAVMIKGSLGTRMAPLVAALRAAYPEAGSSAHPAGDRVGGKR